MANRIGKPGGATVAPPSRLEGKNGKHGGGGREDEPRGVTRHRHTAPYGVEVVIVGTEDMLFHRYDVEDVKAQSEAPKGSKEKKTDNVESYLYVMDNGHLGVPGLNFKACLRDAGKRFQDPSSPRKSAFDLLRAAIKVSGYGDLGVKKADYVDKRRAVIGLAGITRCRPALVKGWRAKFLIEVIDPEFVQPDWLNTVVQRAGRSIGLCDFRPDFGTFRVESFKVVDLI